MQITIRGYESRDLPLMVAIWNEVVEDGIAFPQEELLTEESGREFFAGQSWCGVAEDEAGKVLASSGTRFWRARRLHWRRRTAKRAWPRSVWRCSCRRSF